MRNENYFKIKLENCRETLQMATMELEHLDIQMAHLKEKYDYDKAHYNDRATRMQEIVADMKKRIPKLEKQISKGYVAIDMRTGKGYKSVEERHIALLNAQIQAAEDNYTAAKERYEQEQALKEEKNPTEAELEIIEATRVRESLQPEEELQLAHDNRLQDLEAKKRHLEEELAKLQDIPKVKIKTPESEPIEETIEEDKEAMEEAIEDIIEEEKNEIYGVVEFEHTDLTSMDSTYATTEDLPKIDIPEELKWIQTSTQGQALSRKYHEVEGGHAIWQGKVTNGFRDWCEENNLKIGE